MGRSPVGRLRLSVVEQLCLTLTRPLLWHLALGLGTGEEPLHCVGSRMVAPLVMGFKDIFNSAVWCAGVCSHCHGDIFTLYLCFFQLCDGTVVYGSAYSTW